MLRIHSCDLIFLTLSGLSSSDTEYLLGLTLTGVNKGSCYGAEFVSIFSKKNISIIWIYECTFQVISVEWQLHENSFDCTIFNSILNFYFFCMLGNWFFLLLAYARF